MIEVRSKCGVSEHAAS